MKYNLSKIRSVCEAMINNSVDLNKFYESVNACDILAMCEDLERVAHYMIYHHDAENAFVNIHNTLQRGGKVSKGSGRQSVMAEEVHGSLTVLCDDIRSTVKRRQPIVYGEGKTHTERLAWAIVECCLKIGEVKSE